MSFDENPKSSEKIVNPLKRTTKVNVGMAAGVVTFLLLGGLAIVLVARYYSP